jgi:hypothetical protein
MRTSSRRQFLHVVSLAVPIAAISSKTSVAATTEVTTLFPTQAPELVQEMVVVAHGNITRVKELVSNQPTLAKATWDWGFGDWETALGAASHVGNREICFWHMVLTRPYSRRPCSVRSTSSRRLSGRRRESNEREGHTASR